MNKAISRGLVAAALLSLGGAASAQLVLRVGGAYLSPHSKASDAVGPMLPGPPSGVSLTVDSKSTLFFSLAYPIDDRWNVELAFGTPPTHNVRASLASSVPANVQPLNGQVIARVRQLAPTLFVNYNFGQKDDAWRPFVGAGINYTNFDKRTSTAAGNALNGGPTDIRLSDSWGWAVHTGVTYRINPRWSVTGDVTLADVRTKLTTNTAGVQREIDIRFRPVVTTVSVGYTF